MAIQSSSFRRPALVTKDVKHTRKPEAGYGYQLIKINRMGICNESDKNKASWWLIDGRLKS